MQVASPGMIMPPEPPMPTPPVPPPAPIGPPPPAAGPGFPVVAELSPPPEVTVSPADPVLGPVGPEFDPPEPDTGPAAGLLVVALPPVITVPEGCDEQATYARPDTRKKRVTRSDVLNLFCMVFLLSPPGSP